MKQGQSGVIMLVSLAFILGMFAPVPECFVTRLICPVKASHAGKQAPSGSADACVAPDSRGHAQAGRFTADAPSRCGKARLPVKLYVPDLESIQAPLLPAALPALSQTTPADIALYWVFHGLSRHDPPDPIPILLKTQSRLI